MDNKSQIHYKTHMFMLCLCYAYSAVTGKYITHGCSSAISIITICDFLVS